MAEKKKQFNSAISDLLKQLRDEKADLTPEEIMEAIRALTRAHKEAVKHDFVQKSSLVLLNKYL